MPATTPTIEVGPPTVDDGAGLWRIAAASKVLDVNASYAYLLWSRDFAGTSAVARVDGEPVGFVSGYLRPDEPGTLMIWQVAVDEQHRGNGLAGRLLDDVAARTCPTYLETTITEDNHASAALFHAFARSRGADVMRKTLFEGEQFPDGHDPEVLYRIGPLATG